MSKLVEVELKSFSFPRWQPGSFLVTDTKEFKFGVPALTLHHGLTVKVRRLLSEATQHDRFARFELVVQSTVSCIGD
jgi:hypothetical protein